MTFAQIPAHEAIFLDANTLVYHFSQHPALAAPCTQLLDRVAHQELSAFTSASVLSDVAHRLMVLEAAVVLGWTGKGISKRLRAQPAEIHKFVRFQQSIQEVPQFGIQVFPVTWPLIETATVLSRQLGLLSGDALIAAVMQENGLKNIASHDDDFDRVPNITRYAPV